MTMRCEQLLDALNDLDKKDAVASNTDLGKAGKWTILVYLDADNNLEGAGVGDVDEMINRTIGGLGNNKVYVLMDRIGGYDDTGTNAGLGGVFTGAKLFEVTGGGTSLIAVPTTPATITAQNVEINMGDGANLQKFLTWGLAQAVANNSDYVYLDIWDHGAGWGGQAYGGKAVAWDDTDPGHDALSIDEIRTAITNAHAAGTSGGKKVTILGFDACYMGTVENIFSFKDLVSIVVGSEEVEPGNGWDYVWIPKVDTSPTDVASAVVSTYRTYYASQSGSNVTLAAYDLSKSASLQGAIDNFVSAIGASNSSIAVTARSQAQNYNNNFSVDLYHFAQLMNLPESNGIKTAISNMLIQETHTAGGTVGNSHGMTIYFPTSTGDYDTTYDSTVLAGLTKWDEFISGKVITYQASTTEPGDATCGVEPNNTSSTAKAINTFIPASTPCTGYIFAAGDADFYRFSLNNLPTTSGTDATRTLTVSLTNIPSGANFDVYVYAPFFSPSSAIAIGAAASSNGSESFSIELGTGKVTYTSPNLSAYNGGICDPGSSSNTLHQYGYCYGQGTVVATGAHNFYIVVQGKNNSYSQIGKYTLTVSTGAGVTVGAPLGTD
jgi:hypothetical protein